MPPLAEKHHVDRIGAALWPVAALFLITVCFYWKLSFSGQYVWFDHPDMCYLEIPRLQYEAAQIHAGHFPLWDSALWSGQPQIGQTQPGPLFPLNILFFLAPLRGGYIRFNLLNWYYVLVHFLAAWFGYLLCRDLGRSIGASILAGCAFAFGGFVGTVAWLDVFNGAIWTPLIFLYLFRAVRGRNPVPSAALCGFWLGIAWLCGHHEIPMLVSYTILASWIVVIARGGRPVWPKLRPAVVTFLIAGLVAAVQLLPTYEFGRLSKRWIGAEEAVGWNDPIPYTIPTIYSMPPRAILGTILPGQGSQADSSPFLGMVACSAAILGLIACWREGRVQWMALLGAIGLAYSLGAFTPLHGVLSSFLPILSKSRIPVRALHLVNFTITVLSAYGIDALLNRTTPLWSRRTSFALAGLGGLIILAAIVKSDVPDGVFFGGLIAIGSAAVMAGWLSGSLPRRSAVAALLALALTELYYVATPTFSNRYSKDHNKYVNSLTQNKDIVDFIRKENAEHGPLRVNVSDVDVPLNFGEWNGVDMLQGYTAGVTLNVLQHELHTRRTQSLFGVTHWIGKNPDRPDQHEVFAGESGVKVWRNPDPMPRAWAVHEAVRVNNQGELRILIQDNTFDFHKKTILMGGVPRLEVCSGEDQVRLAQRNPDRITIAAQLPCRGMVILAENNYPGWEATVDGEPVRVWDAYGSMRGAVVDGGAHTVVFRFRPKTVYYGAVLSGLGILLTLILSVLPSNRPKTTSVAA